MPPSYYYVSAPRKLAKLRAHYTNNIFVRLVRTGSSGNTTIMSSRIRIPALVKQLEIFEHAVCAIMLLTLTSSLAVRQ